jgi:hypothetical protein
MKKLFFPVLAVAVVFMSTAIAQGFPSYYPAKGFQNTGRVDAVYAEESRIVIDDISYQLSTSVVVRSLSSRSDSLLRVRAGAHVGFRLGAGQLIEEFWLLPGNYDSSRRR